MRIALLQHAIRRAIDGGAPARRTGAQRAGSRGGYRIHPGDLDAWVFGDYRPSSQREPTIECAAATGGPDGNEQSVAGRCAGMTRR